MLQHCLCIVLPLFAMSDFSDVECRSRSDVATLVREVPALNFLN